MGASHSGGVGGPSTQRSQSHHQHPSSSTSQQRYQASYSHSGAPYGRVDPNHGSSAVRSAHVCRRYLTDSQLGSYLHSVLITLYLTRGAPKSAREASTSTLLLLGTIPNIASQVELRWRSQGL